MLTALCIKSFHLEINALLNIFTALLTYQLCCAVSSLIKMWKNFFSFSNLSTRLRIRRCYLQFSHVALSVSFMSLVIPWFGLWFMKPGLTRMDNIIKLSYCHITLTKNSPKMKHWVMQVMYLALFFAQLVHSDNNASELGVIS